MHRLLFLLAALGLASCATKPYTSSSPSINKAKEAYADCFEDKGALLASNRSDPAMALAQSVARHCQEQEQALRWALLRENEGTPHPVVYVETLVGRIRQANTEMAADALMIVRSGSPR